MTDKKYTHKEMPNLKKCPFCGGTPWISRIVTLVNDERFPFSIDYTIYCNNCKFRCYGTDEKSLICAWERRI